MSYYLCWNKGMTPTLGKLLSDTRYTNRRIFEVASGEGSLLLKEFDFSKEISLFSIENREISDIKLYSEFIQPKSLN